MRIVVWFSAGAASAISAKLALQKYQDAEIHLVYCDTGGEHPDNKRFIDDCQNWLNHEIEFLKNPKYSDHFEVFLKERYIVGPWGAPCTVRLKKQMRFEYQLPDDIQLFGYTLEETNRLKRFNAAYPEVTTDAILIENGITKENCLGLLWKQGLKIPVMYELGYNHNNCLGCVKGGAGYWNKIRKDFPETFERAVFVEKEVKARILNVPLCELKPHAGNFQKERNISCDFVCELANQRILNLDKLEVQA